MDKAKNEVTQALSFPLSHDVTIGVCGEELLMVRDLPVPMEIYQLIVNAPGLGMFLLESFKENGEELMGPHKDDLWLHRPWTGASAPKAKHSAPVTRVELRVRSTGLCAPNVGMAGGCFFTLVVHVVGRPARAKVNAAALVQCASQRSARLRTTRGSAS